jgi:hypothetical protein
MTVKITITILISILFGLLSIMGRQDKLIKNKRIVIDTQNETIIELLSNEMIDCEIIREANEMMKRVKEGKSNETRKL